MPKRDFMQVARGVVEQASGEQMDGKPLTPPPDRRKSSLQLLPSAFYVARDASNGSWNPRPRLELG